MTEWEFTFRSATGNSDALRALREWSLLYTQSLAASNRPQGRKRARVTHDCEAWLRTAGFVDVSADIRDVPTNAWPAGMSLVERNDIVLGIRGSDLDLVYQTPMGGPSAKRIYPI